MTERILPFLRTHFTREGVYMKKEMDQQDVIEVLKNKEELLAEYEQKKYAHMKEIERLDDDIKRLNETAISDEKIRNICKEEIALRDMYQESLREVLAVESCINYIWFYYLQLPQDMKVILEELYVKKNGWTFAVNTIRGSKTKLCQLKNAGLDKILRQMKGVNISL